MSFLMERTFHKFGISAHNEFHIWKKKLISLFLALREYNLIKLMQFVYYTLEHSRNTIIMWLTNLHTYISMDMCKAKVKIPSKYTIAPIYVL